MESMLVETMHVWNAPGKGFFLLECVVIKSMALRLSISSG
jgi:hypothetical protein